MQVSVEAPSKIERRLTIVVPVEKVEEAYHARIIKLSKTAKINGFRAGKIPLDIIKQRFGDSARQEILGALIESSLYSAIGQEKLNPISVPHVEPKDIIPGQPLEFAATFEVLPEIDQIVFNVPQLEKEVASITEADVTQVIDKIREQHVIWETVERPAQEKDKAIIDFVGSIDAVPFEGGTAHEYPVILGSHSMIPGFEAGIIGGLKGEEKVIHVTFPESYHAKALAGKAAEFKIKIINVMAPQLPNLDEEFIKKFGVKSGRVEDFRSEIHKNLDRELNRIIKNKLKTQVFDKLIEQNTIEIPKALIEREANRIHDELHPHHKGEDHGHTDSEMEMFYDAAKRNVKLGLLMGEFIKKHQITSNQDRINAQIETIAASYEDPKNVRAWYSNNKKALAEIEAEIIEELAIEKLLAATQVIEKVLSYNELIGSRLA